MTSGSSVHIYAQYASRSARSAEFRIACLSIRPLSFFLLRKVNVALPTHPEFGGCAALRDVSAVEGINFYLLDSLLLNIEGKEPQGSWPRKASSHEFMTNL